jgi:FkbM family methyltransferase
MSRISKAVAGLRHLLKENGILPVARFSAYRLSKKDALLPLRVGGANLWLRTMNTDLVTARHCLAEGEFDAAAELVRDRKAPLFIVDAGGYIGTAAIALAQLFPNATIVTLEPSDENYRILAQNVEPYGNIVPIHAALDAEDGEKPLFDRGTGDWGFSMAADVAERGLPEVGMTRTVSIPSLLAQMKRERVDILKLDIEGAERDVLSGSASWIDKVDMLFVELHDRIVPGCTDAYMKASEGMKRFPKKGDKNVAVRVAA